MKKLHIAIVTNNYKPYKGGVVSSIEAFTWQLLKSGNRVSIITLDFTGQNKDDPDYVYRIKCPIKFKYKTNPIGVPWLPDQNVTKIIKEIAPDVIHSQHPFLLGVSALKASKKFNIPIFFTYHSRYEEYAHYLPIPQNLSIPVIKKLALNYCNEVNAIIAPTQSTRDFLIENKIKTAIHIIPSGISDIFFEKNNKIFKHQKNNIFKLLTVSRFTKEKNIPFLLDVFSNLDFNYHFTLVGYGSELNNLKDHAFNKLKIDKNRIEFIIAPPKNELRRLYQKSHLFIFASKTETQGIVLAEAMTCGLPVIALNAPGACDIIFNGENGFLVNSKEEMVDKIKSLKENSLILSHLSAQASNTAENYSITEATKKLIRCYIG